MRADHVVALGSVWRDAALAVTGTPDLGAWLSDRLDDLSGAARLDEAALVAVLDELSSHLRAAGRHDLDNLLTRRLLRGVYEFLLAVDARSELGAASAPAQALAVAPTAGGPAPEPPGDAAIIPLPGGPVPPGSAFPVRPAGTSSRPAAVDVGAPRATGAGVAAVTLVGRVDLLLAEGRHGDVAGLLDRAAQEGGVDGIAAVAVSAGDRCRAAGAVRAASDCYLAAWKADRLDETSLWRLAELAMTARDHDLAVSYLDRIAAVLQWRGDSRGVARVYRKMTILAPERDDLRTLLRRAQAATAAR